MARTPEMRFTPATTGGDLLDQLKVLFEIDRKVRKREIQAVAEVNANNFIQNELSDLFYRLNKEATLNTRASGNDFEWLSEIMGSVAVDSEKLARVESYLYKTYSNLLDSKTLEALKEQTLFMLEREFRKMRSLKQAYYYRNRSVKAIVNYIESKYGSDLLKVRISSIKEAAGWINEVKDRFADFEQGERFTRNSYISELDAFLHDAWRELTDSQRVDIDKSFNNRVKSAITGVELNSDTSPQLSRAYQQLSSYYENKVSQSSNKRVDLVLSHGDVEFKAVKGEGLYAYYMPHKGNRAVLKDLAAQVLAASFDEEGLPDIGTQIIEEPTLILIIKCLGKPSAATIKEFEDFVGRALK